MNRTATGWLIRRFLEPGAEILFVEPDEVAEVQAGGSNVAPECAGLWAISQGFGDAAPDDGAVMERASFLYDSLYAHLRRRVADEERAGRT